MQVYGFASPRRTQQGFTRADLCAVILAAVLLLCLVLPVVGKMQPRSERASCANNLRQLSVALSMYTADNKGGLPMRRTNPNWTTTLLPYYKDVRILVCPIDQPVATSGPTNYPADNAPRSYLYNGWNDYYILYFGQSPIRFWLSNAVPTTAITDPAGTITLGEKTTESFHFYADFDGFDDLYQIEQSRHGMERQPPGWGGSNYAFADGSVNFLKYGASLYPVNLWAITDLYRTNTIPMP